MGTPKICILNRLWERLLEIKIYSTQDGIGINSSASELRGIISISAYTWSNLCGYASYAKGIVTRATGSIDEKWRSGSIGKGAMDSFPVIEKFMLPRETYCGQNLIVRCRMSILSISFTPYGPRLMIGILRQQCDKRVWKALTGAALKGAS